MSVAFDAANPNISIDAMVRHGAIVAPVYIVGNPGGFAHVDKARVAALRKAGLAPLPNWERAADFFRHCTVGEARAAGVEALVACRDLGFPADGSIDVVFSFDYDIPTSEYPAAAARLIAASQGLDGHYRGKAYGPIGFLEFLGAHQQPGPHWLMASTFRATSQFHAAEVSAPHVALVQSHDAAGNWLSSPIPGTDINTVINPHGLGAWWPDGSPYAPGGTVSKQDVLDALADPEGRKLLAQAVLSADIVPAPGNPPDPANPTWATATYLRLIYNLVASIRAQLDPAKLGAAIIAALPDGETGLTKSDVESAVETGVRNVLGSLS